MFNKTKSVDASIIALTMMLPKIGRKTAFKIFQDLEFKITGYDDLFDHLADCRIRLKTPNIERADFNDAVEQLQRTLDENEKYNIKVVSFWDDLYPQRILKETDAPVLLYYKGEAELLNHPHNVGVIGTREPYEKAIQLGQNLSRRFAERQFNIVSGLAKGCDTSGHLGALDANGKTTAVLAHGLQMIYPKENMRLAQRIVDNGGLLISEYSTGTTPLPNYFVERDRLQAYFSDLLVVVQSDVKGGTMHAVGTILKSKKRLAVMYPNLPDFRNHDKSRGNQLLIKESGAIPLVNKEDIDNLIDKYIPRSENQSTTENESSQVDAEAIPTVASSILSDVPQDIAKDVKGNESSEAEDEHLLIPNAESNTEASKKAGDVKTITDVTQEATREPETTSELDSKMSEINRQLAEVNASIKNLLELQVDLMKQVGLIRDAVEKKPKKNEKNHRLFE